ncbi:MAG TPA: EAL domain-containing protein [Candidatus Dormibacteraeota bacterium]|nr:EAL domain-containing protein [Candidatus Dormibacteraeota bacterium]
MPSEQQLSNVLSEFARTMVTDFPIQGILDHLVLRIVDILPITAAGVTLIAPGRNPRYLAASNASALRFEHLQTELGEGPCLEAHTTCDAVAVPDLRLERRFPNFVPRALSLGLVAVFTFPLRKGDARLGALDLYRDTPGPLDSDAMTAAQTLADVAAAYLLNAQARADLQDSSDRSRETSRHDALTGLPNRIVLLERLEHALLRSRRSARMAAVLFADLDQFKTVNDIHGHQVGDELLVAVAHRLTRHLRPGDTLARLSGDEFVILCEDVAGRLEVDGIAARIGATLGESFVLSSGEVHTTASIGIALAGRGDRLPEELLHDADLAMYQAKRKGGARHQVIDLGEQRLVEQRASLQRDLHRACRGGELRMEYQPIVRAVDGRIVGVEALLRWAHPSRGLVSPSTLIPLAEQTGLITEIGPWVLEQACLDLRRWRDHHQTDELTVSANVSAHQLMSPEFTATVEDVLLRTGTGPRLLTLEVTESIFVRDSQRALLVLNDLKNLGVMLALDDFGAGYSSLSHLSRFPVDIVKMDPGFVANLGHEKASHAIVSAVIELAHTLRLTVGAKGVETVRQHDDVATLGCDACQGYYFARPMPAEAFDALMGHRVAGGNPRLPLLASAS